MRDHAQALAAFDYTKATTAALQGSLQALNACIECCDRYTGAERVALHCEDRDGRSARYTFEQLQAMSARLANVLKGQGVGPGDRVAGLLPRTVELLVTILATWRVGAVYQPLFTAFGPKAIEHRLAQSQAKVLVTNRDNRGKLDTLVACPSVITVGAVGHEADFHRLVDAASEDCAPVMRSGDDPFLLMFTSGTTGPAKPLEVPLRALVAFKGYMCDAIDLRPEDSFWNLADPGWAYGLYYAVTGPLSLGHATTFYDGPFDVDSCIHVITRLGITNLAGSPTAYRLLIAAGSTFSAPLKGRLRVVSSAGEPLNPEVIRWFADELQVTIHDHYGQTELGMVLCNHHGLAHPVRPGSAGFAVPGHRVVVLDEAGEELPPGQPGILAIDRERSPLCWFAGYHQLPTKAFVGRYYLSGDTVEANDDGSISFVGRSDDVITTSGYRVGPFDVESALIEHPAVIEAAVVGKPDPQRTELIKAFVVLAADYSPSAQLEEALRQHVRQRLYAHAYPREIEFVDELPKTPSGKLQRFILRNQEIARQHAAQSLPACQGTPR
ncbi:AMP-binding protein [Pseudomonas sp. S75]|uniref:AMP-binding protein n=1 Tax=unclassified Pseudomonas TaxID=196821 RepID=UPI001906632C|nr:MULTISPECIES: AMP-binding protein [unclassified Pseudomonas]MBJ9976571.1 AMP-binding protein [Pseudomonas sp. S30]MBK0154387.1 AMP-binding protein [Pseudomonas sp. S75]